MRQAACMSCEVNVPLLFFDLKGVGGTVVSESALRSAGTLLSRVQAPPPAPWPDGGPKSLRSPCCGLAIYTSPQQGDLRLSGPLSSQGAGGEARTRGRRVPADLRADCLATVPPTPSLLRTGLGFCVKPVHSKVISDFQALRLARLPVSGLEPETVRSLQI
ncbi:hypothetical protein PoB_005608000 [Plakobranchus ocellatus]|uniref:Uncharacterized protein n=1 Tax=Plakobranchus ocellatus TaxID=259542 RepID=A0AAV4CA35_9GAST|nr:hypothetical protein PoB_005608000 [Plakobranchus ocellatus]